MLIFETNNDSTLKLLDDYNECAKKANQMFAKTIKTIKELTIANNKNIELLKDSNDIIKNTNNQKKNGNSN